MTNREWLNTLTNEEFVSWLFDPEIVRFDQITKDGILKSEEPTPKLQTLKYSNTSSSGGMLMWLKEERKK